MSTCPAYVTHFALSAPPLVKEIGDGDLWLPPSKTEIVESVCEAAEERECVALVGDPGVGKTCVLRAIRHRLPPNRFRLTYCHNATLGKRDFY